MIRLKTEEEVDIMREGGRILAYIFDELASLVKVGVNALYLDEAVRKIILKNGATPSFLGYRGYKYSTCISRNEEIVHGIPHEQKVLYPGDICSIDAGVYLKGFHVDAARTFRLDPIDDAGKVLVETTEEAFFKGIEAAMPGKRMGVISHAIQTHIEAQNLGVIRDLYSHGGGLELHEDPLIPNFG